MCKHHDLGLFGGLFRVQWEHGEAQLGLLGLKDGLGRSCGHNLLRLGISSTGAGGREEILLQ